MIFTYDSCVREAKKEYIIGEIVTALYRVWVYDRKNKNIYLYYVSSLPDGASVMLLLLSYIRVTNNLLGVSNEEFTKQFVYGCQSQCNDEGEWTGEWDDHYAGSFQTMGEWLRHWAPQHEIKVRDLMKEKIAGCTIYDKEKKIELGHCGVIGTREFEDKDTDPFIEMLGTMDKMGVEIGNYSNKNNHRIASHASLFQIFTEYGPEIFTQVMKIFNEFKDGHNNLNAGRVLLGIAEFCHLTSYRTARLVVANTHHLTANTAYHPRPGRAVTDGIVSEMVSTLSDLVHKKA